MSDPLQEIIRRPALYENVDGTLDLYFGLMLTGTACICYLPELMRFLPPGIAGYLLAMLGVITLPMLFGVWLRRMVRKYITYPRTGYIAPRRALPGKFRNGVLFVVGLSVAAALLASVAGLSRSDTASLAVRILLAAAFAFPYAVFAIRYRSRQPWKPFAAAAMLAGLVLMAALVPGGVEQWSRPAMLFTACGWFLSGFVTLWLYLRATRALTAGAE